MDFKFIIILGLVSLLILYIINEFKLLKSHIASSNDNTTRLIKTKFNILLNDIRELNTDLVNQTKKINKIHSQNITNMSNYFTDSEQEGKQILQYLSENKENKKLEESTNFKIDFGDIKNLKTNDDDIISNSSSLNNLEDVEDLKNKDNISITSDDNSQEDQQEGRLSKTPSKNQDDNDSAKSNKSDPSKIITESRKDVNNEDNKSESKSAKSEKSSTKSSTKIITNNVTQELLEKKSDEKSEKTDKISIESNQVKSIHGLISFGSRKSKGSKPKINIGEDNKSLESNEIKSIKELNSIETYNKKDLENIAKIYNIQTFYKNGNTRKQYTKEELYIKIEEKIKNI